MSDELNDEDDDADIGELEGTSLDDDASGERVPPEEGEEKSAVNSKKLILILVPLILLLGGGAAAYFTGALDFLIAPDVAEQGEGGHGGHGDDGEDPVEHYDPGHAAFLEIPTMIVNLSGEDGQSRFLRLTVQLELASEEDVAAVEAVMPRVVDQFQTYLRELRVKDLRGSAGIYRLQMELLWRVNQAAAPVKVKDVLFQEILIQ